MVDDIKLGENQLKAMKNISKHYSLYLKTAVSNYPSAKKFIETAQLDLGAAKSMNDQNKKELNPAIIFYIQQSVEKFTKAYALLFGSVSKKAMRDIGHLSGRAFVKALRNRDLGKMFDNLRKVSPLIFDDSELRSFTFINLDKEADQMEDLLLSGEEAKWDCKEILDSFDKIRFDIALTLKSRRFNNQVYGLFSKILRPLIEKFWNPKMLDENKPLFVAQYDLLCFLYPMVFITQKHEITSRYPSDKKNEKSPVDYVDGDIDIVKERNRILSGLEKINERINSLSLTIKKISEMDKGKRDILFKKFFGE